MRDLRIEQTADTEFLLKNRQGEIVGSFITATAACEAYLALTKED